MGSSSDFTLVLLLDVCGALAASHPCVPCERHIPGSDLRLQLSHRTRSREVTGFRLGGLGGARLLDVVVERRHFLGIDTGVELVANLLF